jgi:uncharacterized membrane protein YdbT with pleckstrin-like domain
MELLPGETVLFEGRPSWRAQMSHFVGWIPVALAPFVIAVILDANDVGTWLTVWQWFLITVVLLFIVVIVDVLRRYAIFYAVTNQRLRVRTGILSRSEQTARFDRVQNVDIRQSLMDRILHVGTVDFDTAGAGERSIDHFMFRGIADPQALVRIVAENSGLAGGRSPTGL